MLTWNDEADSTNLQKVLYLADNGTQDSIKSTESSTSTNTNTESTEEINARKINLGRSVVSATGYEQDIKEAPASITIIPKEEILTRPIRDLGDAIKDVPGVYVEETKTGSTISMRGLDSNYTLILIDGKRQNVNGSFNDNGYPGVHSNFIPPLSMIERIEVLRGPASVVWGSDAMGGVINIITKKNPNKLTANIMLETRIQEHSESFGNTYGINAYLATPIIKDRLSLSLRGKYQDIGAMKFLIPDGYQICSRGSCTPYTYDNPYTSDSNAGAKTYSIGGRVDFTPSANNHFYIDGDFQQRILGILNRTESSQQSIFNTYDKSNIVLNHNGDYHIFNMTSYLQYVRTRRIPHVGSTEIGVDSNKLDWSQLRKNENYIFDSKIKKIFDFDDNGLLTLNGGVYYLYETLYNARSQYAKHFKQHQAAAYIEGEYTPSEFISASLGLRYNYSDIYKGTPNPRIYVNFNPTQWLTFKIGISSGFKVPNISYLQPGIFDQSGQTPQYGNPNLQAEKSLNRELNVIFDFDRYGLFILGGFHTSFTDKVTTVRLQNETYDGFVCNGSCIIYDNVDKALIYGAEASYNANFPIGIGLNLAYTFTESEQQSGANAGLPLNYMPRHKASAKLSYNYRRFSSFLRWSGKFQTPISATSSSGQALRAAFGTYYKDYSLVDLGIGFRFSKFLSLNASVNNLFDVDFRDVMLFSYVNTSNQTTYFYNNAYDTYLYGRNYWVSLKVDF